MPSSPSGNYPEYELTPPRVDESPESLDEAIFRVDHVWDLWLGSLWNLRGFNDEEVPIGPSPEQGSDWNSVIVLAKAMAEDLFNVHICGSRLLMRVALEAMLHELSRWEDLSVEDD